MEKNQIFRIYGTDYKDMTVRLLEESRLEELIGDRAARICIKPNLVTPSPADYGATTHPEVVAGIVEYRQARHCDRLLIAEGSWVGDRTSEAYEYCGYRALCETYGVPFVDTQKVGSHSADCAGMRLEISDVTGRFDFLINVPVLKGHCQTKMTCALKNLKGLLPNREKTRFHRLGLHRPIAHLQAGIRQDFIVVDHICGDLDFEEGGNPVVRNCVMTALDPVLTDAYACRLLNYTPDDVPYVRMAEQLGIGSTDLDAAEIRVVGERETGPEHPRTRRLLDVSYAVDEADSCSACYASLTGALLRLKEEGLLDLLKDSIGIGQGMRGRRGKLGVGDCTAGFDASIEGCPPSEDRIYNKLRDYILQGADSSR